jgi:hypothetical protein
MLSRTRQILIAIVALAVIAMLWLTGNEQPAQEDLSTSPAVEAQSPPEPGTARGVPRDGTLDPVSIDPKRSMDRLPQVQAATMQADYQADAAGADQRYRGQYLIVEGVASGIRREANDQVFLDIRTDDAGQPVRAALLKEQICGPAGRTCEVEARATMVRRGQKVAVECTGAGMVDGAPRLEGCLVRGGAN